MLQMSAPSPLVGDLLEEELAGAGLETTVTLDGNTIELAELDEDHRAAATPVVTAHPTTAQASLDSAEAERANEASIRARADTALATNTTFLNLASPTNAQNAAQVKALTRQVNGLIRLALRRFDSAD